jgi:hypothetical protein
MASSQPRTPLGWFVQALAFCLGAVIFYTTTKPSPTLAADRAGFDRSPTCQADKVVSDTAEDPLTGPPSGRCVVQVVRITNKHIEITAGRHRTTSYWVTVLMPWGAQHNVKLQGGVNAYNAAVVGHQLNALLWSHRLTFLAINGQPISTAENPDIEHRAQIVRWGGLVFLLVMGLVSVYRAVVG